MGIYRFSVSGLGFGRAHVAQLAEHVLGKDEVISSILIMGSKIITMSRIRSLKKYNQHQEIE